MKILDGRTAFSQWDVDVKITADDLKVGDEVHFHNGTTQNALVLKAYQDGATVVVDVPNIFLTTHFSINAYRYIESAESSYTIQKHCFPVDRRPKPDDYVYTQTEVFQFEDLKKEIEDIMGDVSSALDELHTYAQSLVNGGESE